MSNTLIDNSEGRKLVKVLRDHISDQDINLIQIATGFWDIPGFALVCEELKGFLERKGTHLQLLIGTDLVVRAYQLEHHTIGSKSRFPEDFIKRNISELQVTEQYVNAVRLLLDYCTEDFEKSKIQIKIYRKSKEGNAEFLHAKCYTFLGPNNTCGIIGSSNFTKKGLEDNAELNHLECASQVVTSEPGEHNSQIGHKYWFKQKWEKSTEWNKMFLEEVLRPSKVAQAAEAKKHQEKAEAEKQLSPYEVYIKYLQLQFGDMVDADTAAVLQSYLPANYNSLEFQLDAVKQCFSVMKRYGGFILGDVVGLGKTVVGLLLIRYFLENAENLGRQRKVLIITPPAIKANWEKTIKDFDREAAEKIEPCITFVTTGSVGNLSADDADDIDGGDDIQLSIADFGLVLIDESHGFRNAATQKYQAVNDLIGSINPTPFVALLSATPQNNSPKDIYNQIRLFQRDPNNSNLPAIEGGRLDSFFNDMEHRFMDARNMPQDTPEDRQRAHDIIAEVSAQIRKRVLNELVVRRTRTDIKKMYGSDAETLKFPDVKGPHKLEYHMHDSLQQLFFDTITAICPPDGGEPLDPRKHIGFYRYAAITRFTDPANTRLYEKRNLTVDSISRRLQRIMRMLLVKRLESSIAAFKTTLANIRCYNDVMIDMLENDCVYICPDIEVNAFYRNSDGDFEKFRQSMDDEIRRKGGNNRRFRAADFKQEYLKQLKDDRRIIGNLLERWSMNSFDPKFERFKEALVPELFATDINNPSGLNKPRLVIFTEAINTLDAIAEFLKEAKGYKVLKVSANNRNDQQELIRLNFDANCPPEEQRDDFNVIVTTEVLAEGVNLHRANVILNYDAPWNATRLMQRIGRVNRIGSLENFVHVFNFFPSEEGNSQIRLVEKAYAKLQSFHEMFGEDNKVFSEREQICEHDLQQMVDGDESPFGPYVNELKAYRSDNPERYAAIAALEPLEIGGTLQQADASGAVYVFTDNSGSFVSVKVDEAGENAKVISSLATMEALKCDPETQFSTAGRSDMPHAEEAKRAYQQHVAHYLTAQDTSRKITEALGKLAQIRRRYQADLSTDSRRELKRLENLARANDAYIIKQILRFNVDSPSLFGIDYDINPLINAHFANISSRARQRRGDARIALYEIK